MAQSVKEVKVVINGEEYVSKAAGAAETGMLGFMNKIPGWAKAAGVLAIAWKAIGEAVAFAKDYVMDSITAFDAYSASQNKMAAQSKLTGVSIDDLKAAAKRARDEFGLSMSAANDAATTTAKYASRAGDATLQSQLLASALNLGAASGLTAAESMQALEMGLRGQDEGFDKLLGKNPSTIWKEYADANDLAVGKMTDTQKRMAELTAVVEAGNIVGTAYNDRLESGAGKTEQLSNASEQMKVAFGAAIQPIRILIVEGLTKLIQLGTPVVVVIGKIANGIGVTLAGMVQLGRSAFGSLIEVVGKLTGNDALQQWGEKQSKAFPEFVEQIRQMEKKLGDSGEAATKAGRAHQLATITVTASAKANADAVDDSATRMMNALDTKLGGPMRTVIGLTEGAIRDLATAANEQLPPESAGQFVAHMQTLADRAKDVEARLTATAPQVEKGAQHAQSMATEISTVARAALDAAQAFGVIDQEAASALNSAVNIAGAIGQLATGNVFAGVAGILGGVANIVNVMVGGDRERRLTMQRNTQRIEELTTEIGNLDLNITGEDFATAQGVLQEIAPLLSGGPAQIAANMPQIISALSRSGMTLGDLTRIADELGINIKDKNGNIDFKLIPQLLTAINATEFGQFGNDFASQLRATTTGFNINNVGEVDQISQIANLGGNFSSALRGVFDANDLAGSRSRLQGLFQKLQDGSLSPQELGGLTGNQFLSLITDLISRIDNLSTGTGGGSVGGTTPPGDDVIGGPATGGEGGVPGIPQTTLTTVVETLTQQHEKVAAYHVTSLTFMERTAMATEATAINTELALGYLEAIAKGGAGGSDEQLGRRMSLDRRLAGISTV